MKNQQRRSCRTSSNRECNANAARRLRAHLKIRRGRERWISAAAVRRREQRARVSEEWCTGMAAAERPVVGTHLRRLENGGRSLSGARSGALVNPDRICLRVWSLHHRLPGLCSSNHSPRPRRSSATRRSLGLGQERVPSVRVSLQAFANRSNRVSAAVFAILFGVACIHAVEIQPSIRSKWASHGTALACLVGLFAIASGMLTMTRKTRPSLPFLLGLFLFVVGISGIAVIVFPDIVPFSVTLWLLLFWRCSPGRCYAGHFKCRTRSSGARTGRRLHGARSPSPRDGHHGRLRSSG